MATIISFPTRTRGDQLSRSQLDAARVGLELLGADHAHRLPILSAAIANRTIPHEPGHGVCRLFRLVRDAGHPDYRLVAKLL